MDQTLNGAPAGADFAFRFAVVHFEYGLDVEQVAHAKLKFLHPAAAPHKLQGVERSKDVDARYLFFQRGDDLGHRVAGGSGLGCCQGQKARPQAQLPGIEHRHRHGARLLRSQACGVDRAAQAD